jgi:hypothetical protein
MTNPQSAAVEAMARAFDPAPLVEAAKKATQGPHEARYGTGWFEVDADWETGE